MTQEEKRIIQEKMKTHWCTLGGWLPKIGAQVLDGNIAHKKWAWRDSDGHDVEMDGPLSFIMQLSCGHHMDRNINGKSEEDLRKEYVGKSIYCEYCR